MTSALTQKIIALGKAYHLPLNWLATRPHLFSPATIHLPLNQASRIKEAVRTITHIAALPAFQTAVFSTSHPITQHNPGNPGTLLSYDFHLTPEGPKLIEINTNPAGAFLITLLAKAHNLSSFQASHAALMQLFLNEWHSRYPNRALQSVAIVDEDPHNQYFYPEFLLCQQLLQTHQIDCTIVDPSALSIRNERVYANQKPIDLIYNRLTDFDLSKPAHHTLKEAYLKHFALLTPHPYAYALYANKRNLTLLSDVSFLTRCGVDEKIATQLQQVIPPAHMVDKQNADALWNTRKQYFFKPILGHAGKGVYRGYNITKRVLADILAGDYMAQTLVPASEITVDGERRKVDLRAYVYQGEVLNFAARLYQGQTTNFRTPGGGFAMVVVSSSKNVVLNTA